MSLLTTRSNSSDRQVMVSPENSSSHDTEDEDSNTFPHNLETFDSMNQDEQIQLIKKTLFKALETSQDPASLDFTLLNKFLNIHILDKPSNKKTIKLISKSIWQKNNTREIEHVVIDILKPAQILLSSSKATLKLQGLIQSLSKPGKDKTGWIHTLVLNQFLSPLILKTPLKNSNSSKTSPHATRIQEIMEALNFVFPSANLKSCPFPLSEEIQHEYKLFINALGPVTAEEFNFLLTQKISFKEAVDDSRLCLDMKEKLSTKHQDELFVFVEKLKGLTTKAEFKKLIKESAINISASDKEALHKAVAENFKSKKTHQDQLIIAIVDIISQRNSTMWRGMAYDYLDMLPHEKSDII